MKFQRSLHEKRDSELRCKICLLYSSFSASFCPFFSTLLLLLYPTCSSSCPTFSSSFKTFSSCFTFSLILLLYYLLLLLIRLPLPLFLPSSSCFPLATFLRLLSIIHIPLLLPILPSPMTFVLICYLSHLKNRHHRALRPKKYANMFHFKNDISLNYGPLPVTVRAGSDLNSTVYVSQTGPVPYHLSPTGMPNSITLLRST